MKQDNSLEHIGELKLPADSAVKCSDSMGRAPATQWEASSSVALRVRGGLQKPSCATAGPGDAVSPTRARVTPKERAPGVLSFFY